MKPRVIRGADHEKNGFELSSLSGFLPGTQLGLGRALVSIPVTP